MQIDKVIQEKLVRIPEKIFKVFSNHLEQEILNYLYNYKISKWDYEPEHDRIKDIVAKSMGSSNPINVLRACIKALKNQNSPKFIANLRGKKIAGVTKQRDN